MFTEPEINPLEDTHPTQTVRQVSADPRPSRLQRIAGMFSLLGAVGFTLATAALLVLPAPQPGVIPVTPDGIPASPQAEAEALPSATPPQIAENTAAPAGDAAAATQVSPGNVAVVNRSGALPTLSADLLQSLLLTPVVPVLAQNDGQITRGALNPFTIIPQRPRNQVIQYTVEQGDTISELSQRFGVSQESLAWSNDRRIVWLLQPGMVLNIPPVDGVYFQVVGTRTLAEVAAEFGISDPYVVIDSEANPQLFGFDPNTAAPSGTWIFFPGGQAEFIDWTPPAVAESGGSGGSGTSGGGSNTVSFQLGDPGSCGWVEAGAGTAWGSPMAPGTYTVTRGYSSWHPGIDLASSVGTSVYAANGGTVIFAGRNNWGYGLAIVVNHGAYSTLYGHLSQVSVGCGQVVGTGQVIGAVGSTGNSSGPHLHFEIMYGGNRFDPASTLAF